jgi:hypothetical protein
MTRHSFLRGLLVAFLIAAFPLPSFGQRACSVEGSGKAGKAIPSSKKELNKLKNRTEFPSSAEPIKLRDILDLEEEQDPEQEKRFVVVEGFLLDVKREGVESPNCYRDNDRDFHMWMGAKRPASLEDAKAMRAQSVVVEATPRIQKDNPSWTSENLRELRLKKIRVTGWLMFDPEHPPQLNKTRGTLWEVHPILKIEEFSGGKWIDF